jgi:hypothetical protein
MFALSYYHVRLAFLAIFLFAYPTAPTWADALSRMQISLLRATRSSINELQDQRQEVPSADREFQDFRAQIHVHTHLSHDSNATIEEILEAAKKCNTQILLFSDHPAPEHDCFVDGYQGLRDGILMVPGAEQGGFLLFPKRSYRDAVYEGSQGLADLVLKDDGLVFLSHLEERLDWEIRGITGTEIYNTHADVMSERRFMASLRNPLLLMSLLPALQQYPQELFGAILDYPSDYLQRWDQLCQTTPHTGVAANDSHHNQAIRAVVDAEGKLVIEDALGKQVATLDPEKMALIKTLTAKRKAGDVVLELDLDPYDRSFRHVSTHLLMRQLNQTEVWEALKSGRAYVGFEWLADPTGFWFEAQRDNQRWQMGSQVPFQSDAMSELKFSSVAPLPCLFKLIRDGQVVAEDRGRRFESEADQPGVYRLEAWLPIAGELKPWILSNPIYVRGS